MGRARRFLLWDDYWPVTYAQETVEVSTVLSLFNGLPFEVMVSQSFNDGNPDFRWCWGAAVTAPEEGLWEPRGIVTAEHVRHMKNRFAPFRCTAVIKVLKDLDPCAIHMCRWLVDGANAADARAALRPPLAPPCQGGLPGAAGAGGPGGRAVSGGENVRGLAALAERAQLGPEIAAALAAELAEGGAVDVAELSPDDWQALVTWGRIKKFARKRLLQCLPPPPA